MPVKLDAYAVRGELDNTVRGRVTGCIWLQGRVDPVILDLAGDAWTDFAGARITFTNPVPRNDGRLRTIAAAQSGRVGDITASWPRRCEDSSAGAQPVWKNAFYVEWYSSTDGRVVIESFSYEVAVSAHEWRADADEETAQKLLNLEAMRDFLRGVIARPEPKPDPDPDEPWSVDDTSEDEWEQTLKQSDRLTDAGLEVFDKFRDDPESDDKEAFVMGWDHVLERRAAARESSSEDAGDNELTAEDWNAITAEDDGEDFDDEGLFQKHPLMEQATAYLLHVMDRIKALGMDETEPQPTGPLDVFITSVMQISGKLAGVLTGWEKHPMPRGMVLATTRRCLNWANDALSALTKLEAAPPPHTTSTDFTALRPGLFALREGITEVRRELQAES